MSAQVINKDQKNQSIQSKDIKNNSAYTNFENKLKLKNTLKLDSSGTLKLSIVTQATAYKNFKYSSGFLVTENTLKPSFSINLAYGKELQFSATPTIDQDGINLKLDSSYQVFDDNKIGFAIDVNLIQMDKSKAKAYLTIPAEDGTKYKVGLSVGGSGIKYFFDATDANDVKNTLDFDKFFKPKLGKNVFQVENNKTLYCGFSNDELNCSANINQYVTDIELYKKPKLYKFSLSKLIKKSFKAEHFKTMYCGTSEGMTSCSLGKNHEIYDSEEDRLDNVVASIAQTIIDKNQNEEVIYCNSKGENGCSKNKDDADYITNDNTRFCKEVDFSKLSEDEIIDFYIALDSQGFCLLANPFELNEYRESELFV
ncbi:MAG: hypothetical protein K9G11_02870 [Rickettsiaceae bacterium]|nr:hypothetical protein [Rickettsiaceae bacterium]